MNRSPLYMSLLRVASQHPETRSHLLPLLRKYAEDESTKREVRLAERFLKQAAKSFIGEVGGYLYAVQIEGVDPRFMQQPFGRQVDALAAIKEWKQGAKSDWISTKPRKGQKPAVELRRWIKATNPREFWARWDLRVDDDSREIFYK